MVDDVLQLLRGLAPDAGGSVAWVAVVVYGVRALRAELREQRSSRALTSTVGGRVGAVESDLTRLEDALAAQGLFVPGVSRPAVDRGRGDVDDPADVEPETSAARLPVPPLPMPKAGSYARHARSQEQRA